MPLDGAKLICLSDDPTNPGDVIPAHGKTFKFGYYMDCDVVLEHPDALGLQCTIECDAFGRVTIENLCPEQLITLNGKPLKILRPLLHNTEICMLDKKFLWQFEGKDNAAGLITPAKVTTKAEQAPNSEPGRKWRTQFNKRLTIHSFAYCIKADENPQDVEATTTDENKPLNALEVIQDTDVEPETAIKRLSPSPPPTETDLIDLKTPKPPNRQTSFAGQKTPLSSCSLSETVITSYSPSVQTSVQLLRSFAVVQSSGAVTPKKADGVPDVSLGPFQHLRSPLTLNHRPSMHLIDLTTPMKRVATPSSNSRSVLKSALKRNLSKTKPPHQLRIATNTSVTSTESSVYSVHSTDGSVIELSDDGSFSPSPVPKTPPRSRTPQSLMKRAILSSAKKAITKPLQPPAAPPPSTPLTPKTNSATKGVRFQSQSTPQRKSIGRLQSASGSAKASLSMAAKTGKSMITSTPFRAVESSRTLSSSRSPSTSLIAVKNKSRNSMMLKQALWKSPKKHSAQKSVLVLDATSGEVKARKSVSFLDRIVGEPAEDNQPTLNETFSVEEIQDDATSEVKAKDATFSPEKDPVSDAHEPKKIESPVKVSVAVQQGVEDGDNHNEVEAHDKELPTTPQKVVTQTPSPKRTPLKRRSSFKPLPGVSVSPRGECSAVGRGLNVTFSPEKNADAAPERNAIDRTPVKAELMPQPPEKEEDQPSQSVPPRTPESSKNRSKYSKTPSIQPSVSEDLPVDDLVECDEFEGLDAIFKTPKARNLMILSSPKSISLQKPATDSVELVHSTEFDLSTNLDDIFKTPHSEFITNPTDVEAPTPVAVVENAEAVSPEEAFDMLVGRPINRKSYARKSTPHKPKLLPLSASKDPDLPKTDIEEWIENVNESIELLDEDEDEVSYFTATQDDFSRDPLMMSSASGIVNTTKGKKPTKTPKDEFVMTIQEDDEEETAEDAAVAKDPLELTVTTPKRSLSPNISGIDLLDHTSESLFSETLAVSDDSSVKETEQTVEIVKAKQDDETLTPSEVPPKESLDKARKEMEEAFKNFEKERRILEGKRLVSTPEPRRTPLKDTKRRTLGNQQTLDAFFDLKVIKEKQDMEAAFEKFEEVPKRSVTERLVRTPNEDKPKRKDLRMTMGNNLASEVKLDLHMAKAEREIELAFANFEEEPEFSEERVVKTPELKKAPAKDHRRTMGSSLVKEVKLDLVAAKEQREMELAFENFEEEPEFSEERVAQTPEPKKASAKDHRRTMGSGLVKEVTIDLVAAKEQSEMELAFENFEEEPEFSEERVVKTPELKKAPAKDHRRTMGSSLVKEVKLDLVAAKEQREMELAFENFEEEPEFSEERVVKTPELKKAPAKDHRRTMGSGLVKDVTIDLVAAKEQREMEMAFENFEEEPEFSEERVAQTPEPKKASAKDHRRTMGSGLVKEVTIDLVAAKEQREMELAFENFEEEPEFSEERVVKTPELKKAPAKDHRRTMGSSLEKDVTIDLVAAKEQREMELAFENFEEEPEFSEGRVVKTPELKKAPAKDHRRTMGSGLVKEVTIDLVAAKEQREMELAFENFEEEPEFAEERVAQTPVPKKTSAKDHRRTMGSGLVKEVTIDLVAAKEQREMELAFENFEEEPEFSEERVVKTPELKKAPAKDHRRTMGSSLEKDVTIDLVAAKEQREMELAFENFEEEPEFSEGRVVKTPELKKAPAKDHRRTMGSGLVKEVTIDLVAAKEQREMELAFENFEEEPEFAEERVAQTPVPKKTSAKDHRRTMGSGLVKEVTIDLVAAKEQREMELAFENFEEEPEFSEERVVKTPELKKAPAKDHRRTMGSSLEKDVTIDLVAAKEQREMELAFENFEEEPEFSEGRVVKTPELKKAPAKDHRRTMGSGLVKEVTIDLVAAKEQREMELAFENFEEEPEFAEERVAQTPVPKKTSAKDHRRTMGSGLVKEVTIDLVAAKEQREMELAFENFEEEPEFSEERVVKTPELKKAPAKDHRRTMGSSLEKDVTIDLVAAKEQREMELAFENFEEEPEFSEGRVVKTPELKKAPAKDHRRTMGSGLVKEVTIDLVAAKEQREMELAFENFEEEPEFSEERVVKTPELKKAPAKDHRRTMGSGLVKEVTIDLVAAKEQREMELAFENFEEEPEFAEERVAQTPVPKKTSAKDHRRTMGSGLVKEVTIDLVAAKEQREMELAFENFEEEPEFSEERVVKTPELKKAPAKDHRRTMGSGLVKEVTIDLVAAKEQREMELAFENFEEEPEFAEERVAQTPVPKKTSAKDHRRTMGSGLVKEVTIDLVAAKEQREMELAFENFEEEPEFSEERVVKTPELKKAPAKDHRRTMGSGLVKDVTIDLVAAKEQREMELAFENFEEEPEFAEERVAQTPEPKKGPAKDHRRTMGSGLVKEVTIDLVAAKEQREMELAFENFEEEPEFSEERVVKTPELKKAPAKDHRRTMGSGLVKDVTIDLVAAKEQREMEMAFENFEEEPEFSEERVAQTPEPKKASAKDHRRTMGSGLVKDVTIDLVAAKEQREMELAFENFEEEPEYSEERTAQTPGPKKSISKDHRRTMGTAFILDVNLDLGQTMKAERENEREREDEVKLKKVAMVKPSLRRKLDDPFTVSEVNVTNESKEEAIAIINHDCNPEEVQDEVAIEPQPIVEALHSLEKGHTCSTNEDMSTNVDGDSHDSKAQNDHDSTDEEVNLEPTSRKKRMRKGVLAEAELEILHHLEPIAELTEVKPEPVRQEESVFFKSKLNLNAEVEEARDTSGTVRARTVQLSVALRECKEQPSKTLSSSKVESSKEPQQNTEPKSDADEMVPSTPLPAKTRGRRPQKKTESAETAATVPRRGRRGSVQQDVVAEQIDPEEVIAATPSEREIVPKDTAIEMSTPVRRTARRRGGAKEDDVEEVIPSTPGKSKTRGRKAVQKSEPVASKKSTPIKTELYVEEDKSLQTSEQLVENINSAAESSLPKDDDRHDTNGNAEDGDVDEVVLSTPAQPKRRGRKPTAKAILVEAATAVESPVVTSKRRGLRAVVTEETKVADEVAQDDTTTLKSTAEHSTQADEVKQTEETTESTPVPSITSETRRGASKDPPLKTRGRKEALKSEPQQSATENLTPSRRGGRRRGVEKVEHSSTAEDTTPLDDEVNVKTEPIDAEEVALPSKIRTRRATHIESIEPRPRPGRKAADHSSTPVRRGGRRKVVEEVEHSSTAEDTISRGEEEHDVHIKAEPTETQEEVFPPPLPSKIRTRRATHIESSETPVPEAAEAPTRTGRRAASKLETVEQSSTPVRKPPRGKGAHNSTTEDAMSNDDTEQTNIPLAAGESDVSTAELPRGRGRRGALKIEPVDAATPEVPSVRRGRKPAVKSEPASEKNTSRGGRRRGVEDVPDSTTEGSTPEEEDITKTQETDVKTSAPAKTRGRRGALKADAEETAAASTPSLEQPVAAVSEPTSEKSIQSRKRGRRGVVEEDTEVHTEEEGTKSKKRGKQAPVEHSVDSSMKADAEQAVNAEEAPIPSKKRGRQQVANLQSTQPAAESSTPARKRGRRGTVPEDTDARSTHVEAEDPLSSQTHKNLMETDTSQQKRGQKVVEEEPASTTPANSKPIRRRRASGATEESSAKVPSEHQPSDAAAEPPKATRGRKRLPSVKAAEGELGEPDEQTQKRPARGRRAAAKKDTSVDGSSHTEEEHATTTNSNATQSQKVVSDAEEHITTSAVRGRKGKAEPAPSEDEVTEKKPTRGRKAQPKPEITEESNSQVAADENQPPSATKKPTRGRPAKVAKESDDEQVQPEPQKKPLTRTRKALEPTKEKEEEQAETAPKRANRRNLQVQAEETPTKRLRRKPNILLSDEFVH